MKIKIPTRQYLATIASVIAGFMMLACALPAQTQSTDTRPRIAIMEIPVAANAYYGWRGFERGDEVRMSDVLRDLLTTEFVDKGSGKIRLMERAIMEQILKEQNFGRSEVADSASAVAAGKLLGVKYMVTGKITRFGTKKGGFSTGWGVAAGVAAITGKRSAGAVAGSVDVKKVSFTGRLDLRVIDVETGEIVATANEEGTTANTTVKVAGTGGHVEYDDTMVNQVFEPIVRTMTPKLINKIVRQ
jgi:curli biogenesis system outer membrane secretion channel CsgG